MGIKSPEELIKEIVQEMSLEDKLQAEFNYQSNSLDKNQKYFYFHFSETENVIVKIGNPLNDRQRNWVDMNRHLILEYSNKRSQWELSAAQ